MESAGTLLQTFNFLSAAFLLISLANYTLGFFILAKDPKDKVNIFFFIECFIFAIGCLGYGLACWTMSEAEVFICIGIASIGYCLIWPVTIQFLLVYFFGAIHRIWKMILGIMYAVGTFYIVTWFTGLTASKGFIRVKNGWIDIPSGGIFFNIYLGYCIFCYVALYFLLFISIYVYRKAENNKKSFFTTEEISGKNKKEIREGINHLKSFIVSYIITSSCALYCNIVIPTWDNPIPSIGFLFLAINIIITAYSMNKYKMFVLKNEIAPYVMDNTGEIILLMDENYSFHYANDKFFEKLERERCNYKLISLTDFLMNSNTENISKIISNEKKDVILKTYSSNKHIAMKSTCTNVKIRRKNYFILTFSDINYKIMEFEKNNTVLSDLLCEAVEGSSSDFESHVERVSKISVFLADLWRKEFPKIPSEDLPSDEIIERAAKLHDIGKIKISDSILNYPGKITSDEYEKVKEHSHFGYQLIGSMMGEVSEYAKIIALNHHEKWNGTGYPSKKKEEEIPIIARIVTVADVFDALISKRCYKEAMPPEQVKAELQKEAGEHFDPKIIWILFKKENGKTNFERLLDLYYSIS